MDTRTFLTRKMAMLLLCLLSGYSCPFYGVHPDERFTRVGNDMSSTGIDGKVSPSANLFTIHHVQTSSTLEARKSLFDPGRDP